MIPYIASEIISLAAKRKHFKYFYRREVIPSMLDIRGMKELDKYLKLPTLTGT